MVLVITQTCYGKCWGNQKHPGGLGLRASSLGFRRFTTGVWDGKGVWFPTALPVFFGSSPSIPLSIPYNDPYLSTWKIKGP